MSTNVLTPPSPLGQHDSTQAFHQPLYPPVQSLGHGPYSKYLGVGEPSSTRQPTIPPSYLTPPLSRTELKESGGGSMIHQNYNMPMVVNQPQAVSRDTNGHHTQYVPQQPVRQPQVAYEPVPSAPAVDPLIERIEQNGVDNGAIASYMQIPSAINNSKASLSEFAAQITCLFWFESIGNLQRVEDSASTPCPLAPLAEDAKPTLGFRKWVTTMLSTTQVTQNVILLALMFIYRLKKQNPQVRGKPGSEYRLLTVALMLGNKFLDDNTYTNKTWADVSGISVAEIHVMEVEFLSNMRYTLYTSEKDWQIWHKKLGKFYDYFEKASKSPQIQTRPPPAPPSVPPMAYGLPSPNPSNGHHISPPSRYTSPPYSQHLTPLPRPQFPPVLPEPAQRLPEPENRQLTKKRFYDDIPNEPYSKRPRTNEGTSIGSNHTTPALTHSTAGTPYSEIHTPTNRLPMPNFNNHPPPQSGSNPLYNAHLPPPQSRAMSMVYGGQAPQPPSTSQLSMPSTMATHGPRVSIPSIFDNHMNGNAPQLHPLSTSSPSNLALNPTSHELLSPSGFPMNRSSPYRPVRHVHTLLVPPPSTSFHAPSQNVGTNSMHYQPLGKPVSERRTGVVPYMHHDRSPWAHPFPQYTNGHPCV